MSSVTNNIVNLKEKISSLNEDEFIELLNYVNQSYLNDWFDNFIEENSKIDISQEELDILVEEAKQRRYEISN
jgi:hypothetical protein